MGNVTIGLEKEYEEKLRAIASKKYKNKKGALAKVISESLDLLEKDSNKERAMKRQFRWMDKGFNLGKILVKSRKEIYDR